MPTPTFFPRYRSLSQPIWRSLQALVWSGIIGAQAVAIDVEMPRALFVDQSLQPDARSLAAFDLCILNSQAEVDLEPGHALGNRFLAMLNVAEMRVNSFQAKMAAKRSLKTTPGSVTGFLTADPTDDKWLAWAVNSVADQAAKRGFDGFVLSLGSQPVSEAWRVASLEMAQVLKKRYPDMQVMLDARLNIGAQAVGIADGLLAIGVNTRRGTDGRVELNGLSEAQRTVALLRQAHIAGMRVFGVDFADVHDRTGARDAATRLQSMGVLPFVTTPDLDGLNLGPIEEMSRRILVLHGWDAKHIGEAAASPQSTLTARCLHAPLEWLGCQLEYQVMDGSAVLPDATAYRGVILDAGLMLKTEQQRSLAKWLRIARDKNVPLLLSSMPWTDPAALQDVRESLGLGGSGKPAPRLTKTSIARIDNTALNGGTKVTARALGFLDLQAPTDSHIILAARGVDTLGTEHRFDQAFHAAWGSAWLEPAANAAGPQVDLFQFVSTWLSKQSTLPAMDTTTRDGRRVFFSHVSSEGFTKPSSLPGFSLCAEVMSSRILTHYLLPFSVAVCEADLRGWRPGQNPSDAPRYEQIARSIFDLPNVAAASNSFSSPATWSEDDKINGPLNEHAISTRFDMEREVAGSMRYIHHRLLPAGKSVTLMLWPDDAAPSTEALQYCKALGVQSLSPSRQSLTPAVMLPESAPLASHGMQQGGTIEVFATGEAPTSSRSTPVQQLARLQAGENGRRTSPASVNCCFLDVQDAEGIADLEKALDWCAQAPLHSMSAAGYAASVRDAMQSRILRLAKDHWIILNEGAARTVRLPVTSGLPDLARCHGISGYTIREGQLYIHTMGRVRSEIVLSQQAPASPQLHLVESSAHIEFLELASRRATFQVQDWRPVELVLGGFAPNGQCAYSENGRPYSANADAKGIVRLELSRQATVSVQSLPPAAATAAN